MAKTGPPIIGNVFPNIWQAIAMIRHNKSPGNKFFYFFHDFCPPKFSFIHFLQFIYYTFISII